MRLEVLQLNRRYEIKSGAVVPRSHFNELEGKEQALIQVDTEHGGRVVSKQVIMTRAELKRTLGFKKGVEIEIE